jgi:hypothetical protein
VVNLGDDDAEAGVAAEGVPPNDGRREPLREMLVTVEGVGEPGDDPCLAWPRPSNAKRG